MDGANGQVEIVDKFITFYFALYNSVGTQEEMLNLHEKVTHLVKVGSVLEVTGQGSGLPDEAIEGRYFCWLHFCCTSKCS